MSISLADKAMIILLCSDTGKNIEIFVEMMLTKQLDICIILSAATFDGQYFL